MVRSGRRNLSPSLEALIFFCSAVSTWSEHTWRVVCHSGSHSPCKEWTNEGEHRWWHTKDRLVGAVCPSRKFYHWYCLESPAFMIIKSWLSLSWFLLVFKLSTNSTPLPSCTQDSGCHHPAWGTSPDVEVLPLTQHTSSKSQTTLTASPTTSWLVASNSLSWQHHQLPAGHFHLNISLYLILNYILLLPLFVWSQKMHLCNKQWRWDASRIFKASQQGPASYCSVLHIPWGWPNAIDTKLFYSQISFTNVQDT